MERPEVYDDNAEKIRLGNIKARIRMIYLYNAAQVYHGLVLSTDNYTEYMLGFFTIFGDQGDFVPMQYLWKTEVYEMTEYIVNNELFYMFPKSTTHYSAEQKSLISCIECNATDGLGITTTDLDQILPDWKDNHKDTRSGYKEVDELINMYLTTGSYPKNNKKIVSDRVKATEFKRNHPYITPREIITKNI